MGATDIDLHPKDILSTKLSALRNEICIGKTDNGIHNSWQQECIQNKTGVLRHL